MTAGDPSRIDQNPARLPWPFVAAALVAIAAIYQSGQNFVGMPILAVILLASMFTRWRLPSNRTVGWTARIVVWTFIILAGPERQTRSESILFDPDTVHLFGFLCAAELTQTAWTRLRAGRLQVTMLVLTALVFAAASNTYERTSMRILIPAYAILLILCLRAFSRLGSQKVKRSPSLIALRGAFAVLALGVGYVSVAAVTGLDQRITTWAMQWVQKNPGRANEIGLSGAPRLQSVFDPAESMDRILLINGPRGERYFRATAFDTYENQQWLPTLKGRTFRSVAPSDLKSDHSGQRLRIARLSDALEDVLLVPLDANSVESAAPLERDESATIHSVGEFVEPHYEVVVPKRADAQGPLCLPPDAASRRRLLAVPESIDPRVSSIAQRIGGEGDAMSRVSRIAQHLRAKHSYSLSYDPKGAEPLSDFILNDRAAHCQYFASALVVMTRAVGVPARYVAGYYAHESAGDNRMVVRSRDAHAWAECWIDGVGWITVDATPSGGLPDRLFAEASAWRRGSERFQDGWRAVREWFARQTRRSLLQTFAIPTAILLAFSGLRSLWAKRRVKATTVRSYAPTNADLAIIALRFERWLKDRGGSCEANRTWREQIPAFIPRDRCLNFIAAYDDARFGSRDGSAISQLSTMLSSLESSVILSEAKDL